MNSLFRQSLLDAPIISRGNYAYILHPLCDGFPTISPDLLSEVVSNIKQLIDPYLPIDRIITIEAMGIPLATVLSEELSIPFSIIRKRCYGIKGEIPIKQKTGYAKSTLYLNGIEPDESIIIVDDIISTGGTISAIIYALQKVPVTIKAGFFLIDKGNMSNRISQKTSIPLHALAKICIQNDKVLIV